MELVADCHTCRENVTPLPLAWRPPLLYLASSQGQHPMALLPPSLEHRTWDSTTHLHPPPSSGVTFGLYSMILEMPRFPRPVSPAATPPQGCSAPCFLLSVPQTSPRPKRLVLCNPCPVNPVLSTPAPPCPPPQELIHQAWMVLSLMASPDHTTAHLLVLLGGLQPLKHSTENGTTQKRRLAAPTDSPPSRPGVPS